VSERVCVIECVLACVCACKVRVCVRLCMKVCLWWCMRLYVCQGVKLLLYAHTHSQTHTY
jgi:hypothetical protein